MNAAEILGHTGEWESITRQEAVHCCGSRTVMVLYAAQGAPAVAPFIPGSRFHQANGPYDYASLRYFLKVKAQFILPMPKGGGPPPPPAQPTDLLSEPINELEEPTKKPAEIKITKLDCDSFAPLIDTVLIHYEITGDLDQAKSVHLRIASQKQADKYLLDKQLDGAPQAKGIFMWDGGVSDGDFQGCVNLVASPYWVQLGLAGNGGSPVFTNKAAIKVELMQTELTIGDDFGLGEDAKNMGIVEALRDEVKKTPGKGVIHMPGDFFKLNIDEMYSSASFTVYQRALGKGIPIPLFVKLWLKGKDGSKKRSENAVAGARIVWDVIPEDEAGLDSNLSDRGVGASAKSFIKKVSLYKQDKTVPPGATSQWELGGMRADKRARIKDRQHWEDLDSGWSAAAPAKRNFAGLSKCAKIGTAIADSGMMYYNGRIAGDRYHVAAYVDTDSSLDKEDLKIGDGVPAERKTAPLTLQNWRDVHVVKSYRIGAGTAELKFDSANPEYKKAAIAIIPKPGLVGEEIGERWKSEYKDVVTIMSGQSFIKDAASQDPDGHPVAFISFHDYWMKTNPDAGFFSKLWHRIIGFFGADTDDKYVEKCDRYALPMYSEVCRAFPAGQDGITSFKFEKSGEHNLSDKYAGIAPVIDGYTGRTQSVMIVFTPGQAASTVIHEMGHNLFMPHATSLGGEGAAGGAAPKLHDAVQVCLMSYHPDRKYFCGLCLLRMGGWDHGLIDSNAKVTDVFELE